MPSSLKKVSEYDAKKAKAESQISRLERRLYDREMQTVIFADEDYQRLGTIPLKKRTPAERVKYAELGTFFRQAWAQEMRTEYHGIVREISALKSWLDEPESPGRWWEEERD